MAPICPEKARFSRKDFPPIFSENLGLKPPFVSPPLDFPNRDPFMGLFRGAVFLLGGVPENCPLALMGRFPP